MSRIAWRAPALFFTMGVVTWCTVLPAASGATIARLWNQVTPAAGIPIRSAPNFRAFVISSSRTPSVDIYQLNSDGTSSKLDTITSSSTGVYGSGTYATHDMAAIYWQFTSLPPVSGLNPPQASVTFINDAPTIPLSSIYYNPLPQTPFAASDSSLLLNLDLRTGPPAGWINSGSGAYDSTNGYTPGFGTSSGLSNPMVTGFSSAASMPQGTVAVRFQRTGVATDNSFGNVFYDSTGNTLNATTQNRQLLQMRSNSGTWSLQVLEAAGQIPAMQVAAQTNSMSRPTYFYYQTINSHYVVGYNDPVFSDLFFTWYQNQYYVFLDGHLITAGTLGDIPIYQMFQNVCIGNFCVSGQPSGAPFGSYAIQQVQISTRFLGPVLAGPVIGLLPDSYAVSYTERPGPSPTGSGGTYQVSDINAAQNTLGMYGSMPAIGYIAGQTPAFLEIMALMFENYGFFPPIYNAGQPGHGYSSINAPIDDAFIAALNQAAPTVIMAGGTINDVNPGVPSDGNLVADTSAIMNRLVLGGGTRIAAQANPSLEQIIYLETLSPQAVFLGTASYQSVATETQNIIALTRTGLGNFAPPNAVNFSYVTAREWWDEAPDYTSYLYGSAPSDQYNRPGGGDYQNAHPDSTGLTVIAAHLYAPIVNAVLTTAGADVSITGSASSLGSTSVYSLSVFDAGPLAAAGTIVTSVLPPGTSLVSSSSTPGCAQSGNVLSCSIGAIGANQAVPVTVTLQSSSGSLAGVTFVAGSSNGNDPNTANNSLTFNSASDPASSDGPIPLWALFVLASGILGIASRRLT
jgi:uncharacterized repeat protein (TIGR01451 family)